MSRELVPLAAEATSPHRLHRVNANQEQVSRDLKR
jgi:hypothetical protein